MAFFRKPRPGDQPRADQFNALSALARAIERLQILPPLHLTPGRWGRLLSITKPHPQRPVWGKLSGTTSPYSWTEQLRGGVSWWTTKPGGLSGTTNAYELNGRGGLNNKVVPLYRGPIKSDWVFRWNRYKTHCTARVCVHVRWTDLDVDASGDVEIKDSLGNVAGSGHTLPDVGGTVQFCSYLPPGTYTVKGTLTDATGSVPKKCSSTASITVSALCVDQDLIIHVCCPRLQVGVFGCAQFYSPPVDGTGRIPASISTNVGSCTQPPTGGCLFDPGAYPGTYTADATFREFQPLHLSAAETCRLVGLTGTMVPESRYVCTECQCPQPMDRLLDFTDEHTSGQLTFVGGGTWEGSYTYTEPQGVVFATVYGVTCCVLASITATIFYRLVCSGPTFRLYRFYNQGACPAPPPCPYPIPTHPAWRYQIADPGVLEHPGLSIQSSLANCSGALGLSLFFTFSGTPDDAFYTPGINGGFCVVTSPP